MKKHLSLLSLSALLALAACGPTNNTTDGSTDNDAQAEAAAPEAGGSEAGADAATEASAPEAGGMEASTPEGGTMEAGTPEAGTTEAGTPEAGAGDAASEGGTNAACTAYCTAIMTNCTGANAQYPSMAICQSTCSRFAPGTAADMAGNTLGCRAYHATAAATGVVHCPHAGPSGDGICGANCEGFCSVAATACPTAFATTAACMTACAGFTGVAGHYTSMGSTSGNTFNCREYHLTAATADPATHCGHIVAASPVCM